MSHPHATSRVGLVLALAAITSLAACGSSSKNAGPATNGESTKSGPQVVKDAAAALGATEAAHISGTLSDAGKQTKIDLQLQSDGTSGTLTESGVGINIVLVDGSVYIKAPAAFYTAQKASAAVAAKLANKWVKTPSTSDFNTLTLTGIAKSLNDPDSSTTIENKVTTGTLQGQKVVIVHQADGSLLYVAAVGKPYPLRVTNSVKSKDGAGDATITGYGKQLAITAPVGAIDSQTGAA